MLTYSLSVRLFWLILSMSLWWLISCKREALFKFTFNDRRNENPEEKQINNKIVYYSYLDKKNQHHNSYQQALNKKY